MHVVLSETYLNIDQMFQRTLIFSFQDKIEKPFSITTFHHYYRRIRQIAIFSLVVE